MQFENRSVAQYTEKNSQIRNSNTISLSIPIIYF